MTAKLQRLFNVRRDELAPVLLSTAFFFCVLTALMVLRPARESLGMQSGIETLRWLFIGTAVVTMFVNPVFGLLVARFRRLQFITGTYAFFGASLLGFFALIAVGGTLGAIAGPALAAALARPLGTAALLPLAVGFLALAVMFAWAVVRTRTERRDDPDAPPAVDEREVIGGSAWEGFRAVFRSRYLMGIAGFIVIMTIMGTFIYFTRLQMVAALGGDLDLRTTWFARIDLITQVTTLVLQAVVAGHLMKRFGVHIVLMLLPLTAVLGFVGLAIVGSFAVLIAFEAAFRAVQRALTRPARETLFTVVSREDKYKSKAFIDTFIYRGGDVIGAQVDGLLARLGLGLAGLASVAIPLALVWAALGLWLGRAQNRRKELQTT
jgi:ATP:ADP antiporter, AAA family